MLVRSYYKLSLFNAHTMILIVHVFMTVNKLCLNQERCFLCFLRGSDNGGFEHCAKAACEKRVIDNRNKGQDQVQEAMRSASKDDGSGSSSQALLIVLFKISRTVDSDRGWEAASGDPPKPVRLTGATSRVWKWRMSQTVEILVLKSRKTKQTGMME